MKRVALLFLAAGVGTLAAPGPVNVLTPQEKSQGWQLLFDGKTLSGWIPMGGTEWKVGDGMIIAAGGKGGWLATKSDYSDFSLQADFRTSAANINSGIYLRRGRDEGDSHQIGYELQIRNPAPNDKPYDGKPDNHNGYYTGSFSGHLKSHNEPIITMGEWHHFDLTAKGEHFLVRYDGKTVLDDHHPQFNSGAIGLQYTGQPIEFRNIKIKVLSQ